MVEFPQKHVFKNKGVLNTSFLAFKTPCFGAFKMPIFVLSELLFSVLTAKSVLRNRYFEIGI